MKILDYLIKEAIFVNFRATTKSSTIRKMCKVMEHDPAVSDANQLIKDILAREELESTGIGDELALPHARSGAVNKPVLSIAVSKRGIEFDALDSKPAKLVILIAVPNNQSKTLLKLLAKITQIYKNKDYKTKLLNAKSKESVIDILRKE